MNTAIILVYLSGMAFTAYEVAKVIIEDRFDIYHSKRAIYITFMIVVLAWPTFWLLALSRKVMIALRKYRE